MVVSVYPICESRGIWSFTPQPGAEPVRVRAPKGCKLREIKSWGTELSVPTSDKLVRQLWSANEVMRSVRKKDGRFSVEEPQYQTAV